MPARMRERKSGDGIADPVACSEPCGPDGGRERLLAFLLMTATVVLWGFSFISTKVVLQSVPPASIAFFRQIIAASVLLPALVYTGPLSRPRRRDAALIAGAGLFGIVLYFVFENSGLQYTTASNASMIVSALPAFTLLAEALVFGQKITWKMAACLALSAAGVFLLVSVDERLDLASSRFQGNLMILGAMACWVVYNILIKAVKDSRSSLELIAFQSTSSILLFLPFVLPETGRWPSFDEVPAATLGHLVFLGLFCSALAYLFYIRAVRTLGATVSSAFLNLIPVVTVISGWALLDERLAVVQVLGMAVVMWAIWGLNRAVGREGPG